MYEPTLPVRSKLIQEITALKLVDISNRFCFRRVMGAFRFPNRWLILFVLFFARTAMAFQFQSFSQRSPPLIVENYALTFADIGFLIGLYFAPGIVVAIPGGAISARFGDKRVVTISLILMLVGGGLISLGSGWGALVAGRLLAGIGGVVLNVVMTKW